MSELLECVKSLCDLMLGNLIFWLKLFVLRKRYKLLFLVVVVFLMIEFNDYFHIS